MSAPSVGTVFIKSACTPLLKENLSRITVLFSAFLTEKSAQERTSDGITSFDVNYAVPGASDRKPSPDFVSRLQVRYIICYLHLENWDVDSRKLFCNFVNGFDLNDIGDNTFTFR